MKTVRNFALCAIVAIGFACNATAKQDDKKENKENKEEKDKKDKKDKIVVIDQIPYPTTDKPFSVPGYGFHTRPFELVPCWPRVGAGTVILAPGKVILTCLGIAQAKGILIPVDLGERGALLEESTFSFTGLKGIPLAGHSLSGDPAALVLQTNGTGLVGFLDGSAYLLDKHGDAIPGFGVTGSGSGDDGSMNLGFSPYFRDDTGLLANIMTPLAFYGVHFDMVFPDLPSVEITGSQFLMASLGGVFGIGPGGLPKDIVPSVPDAGNTLVLLSIPSLCLLLIRKRKCPYENIPVHGDR